MATTIDQLEETMAEAQRFMAKAHEARLLLLEERTYEARAEAERQVRKQEGKPGYVRAEYVPGISAALAATRRASMDLTRSLAKMRKY